MSQNSNILYPRIAFTGMAGSGKTTWAQLLTEKYGYERERFAGTIYDGLSKIFGITEADILANKNFWRPVLQAFGTHVVRNPESKGWSRNQILSRLLVDVDHEALQNLYTTENLDRVEAYFKTHPYGTPDAFIVLTRQRVEENFEDQAPIALDDCRFVNEAEACKEMGFYVIKLLCSEETALDRLRKRDGKADPKVFLDPSEREWFKVRAHAEIDTLRSMEEIASDIDAFIHSVAIAR